MNTYDVHVEFVNGQTTWITVIAEAEAAAELDAYAELPNVHAATVHPHGTRPGHRRQGRQIGG